MEEFDALARSIWAETRELGRSRTIRVLRWQDRSGARLTFQMRGNKAVAFAPSCAGAPGARLANLQRLNDDVWIADVVDEFGEVETRATFELEQGRLIEPGQGSSRASVIALARSVVVHRDQASFEASYESRNLHFLPESFVSHGFFEEPADAEATALLNGTVLHAERRTNARTGQTFIVARVRTWGMEVDLCLAGSEHLDVPQPGQLIEGISVLLVVDLADFAPRTDTSIRPAIIR
jgi:hypothetical protein